MSGAVGNTMTHTMPRHESRQLLRLSGICKRYYDSLALDHVSLSVGEGELCAILGENGAGKTALMNIISGVSKADSGQIWFQGKPVTIESPQRAFELGIFMVSQEPELADSLTIEQSIFLNREITRPHLPFIDRRTQIEKVRQVLHSMQWSISPNTLVGTLTPMERKLLLVARALCFQCRLLILDDITANFDYPDAAYILRLIQNIHGSGISILFITHKLEEVLALAQHAVVLAEGRQIADYSPIDEEAMTAITQRMVGPDCRSRYPKTLSTKGRILLSVDRLSSMRYRLQEISLYVREGEIVGVVDLQETSKRALIGLLSGTVRPSSGTLSINGQSCGLRRPADFARAGLTVLTPGTASNLYPQMDAYFNIAASNLSRIGGKFMICPQEIRSFAVNYLKAINMRSIVPSRPVSTLSYGTQQKLALSRMICSDRKVLLMVDPTSGVDCASKVDIYNMMNRIVQRGRAILLFSTDMQEITGMCDRIYVIYKHSIVAHFNGRDVTPQKLLNCAAGR